MQSRLSEIEAAGGAIFAVSSSTIEESAALAADLGLSIKLLSDPQGEVIRAFDLLHENAVPFSSRVVARPAVFIVDARGIVRDRWLTDNWRVRLRAEDLLSRLHQLSR